MRIELNPKSTESVDVTKPVKAKATDRGKVEGALRGQDRAELSPDRQRVQSLFQRANEAPEVREQKVSALRAAVQDGSYKSSHENTAAAMLKEMFRSVA